MTHAEKKVRDLQIVELRKQGYSQTELCEMFGLKNIAHICKRYGVGGKLSDRKPSVYRGWSKNQYKKETFDEEREYVEQFLHGRFSYVGGFVDSEHKVTIKCETCGHVFEHSMVSIRHGAVTICPACIERKKKEQQERIVAEKAERERISKENRERKRRDQERERAARKRTTVCPECGKLFITYKANKVCCSPECTKHRANSRHDRRIAKDKRIDKITVKELYKKDAGICWICGGKCNLDDYITRDGTIICGDNYPSIDHIVPVCEGGADAWDNVRLAHRGCNLARYLREKSSALRPPQAENG